MSKWLYRNVVSNKHRTQNLAAASIETSEMKKVFPKRREDRKTKMTASKRSILDHTLC